MKVSLSTSPILYSKSLKVKLGLKNKSEYKNIKQITLRLDQAKIRRPSETCYLYFTDSQESNVECTFNDGYFYFEVDFANLTKYQFGLPITASIKVELNSSEIFIEALPDIVLVK